ncbi:protein kinase [Streptomyces sp. ME19-01-6]|uniref:protein kinase n=1 Tax=Streptomyces sp. ME19-01-6 TaxID=3028686 RepID=UPI0029AC1B79|nr:protein kinase [Streptomyces sp. ME19-01-6]MDX3226398.1 protein kinase [Streptomyces sp. ME19-01-6]
MDEYAGRVLADRYRLPLPPADEYELVETCAFDTYSGQEVHLRQIPLPETVDAEVVGDDGRYGAGGPGGPGASAYSGASGRTNGMGRGVRGGGADPAVRRAIEAATAAAQVPDHPRLDQVFHVFVEAGSLWIVSELVAGRPLAALLAERTLSPYRAAELAHDILTALRALHADGWIHRNITARTVLVCDDGRAMLTGLAAGAAEEALCGYDPVPRPPADPAVPADGADGAEAADWPERGGRSAPAGPAVEGRSADGGALPPGGGPAARQAPPLYRDQGAAGGFPAPRDPGGRGASGAAQGEGEPRPRPQGGPAGGFPGPRGALEQPGPGPGLRLPPGSEWRPAERDEGPSGLNGPNGTHGTHGVGPGVPGARPGEPASGGRASAPAAGDPQGAAERAARASAIAAYAAGARAAARAHVEGSAPRSAHPSAADGPSGPAADRAEGAPRPTPDPNGAAPAPNRQADQSSHGAPAPYAELDPNWPTASDPYADRARQTDRDAAPAPNRQAAPAPYADRDPNRQPDLGTQADRRPNTTRALYIDPGRPADPNGVPASDRRAGPGSYAGPNRQAAQASYGVPDNAAPGGTSGPGAAAADRGPADRPAGGAGSWEDGAAAAHGARRGPATALAAERARQARIVVVGAVTERWAPEQAVPVHENWRLAPPVGPAADLWAVGVLLFRAVQGHAPYPEESAAELVQLVCSEAPAYAEECGPLRPVVESLMRQDPTERPDFEELRGWLRSLIRSAPEPDVGSSTVTVPSIGPGGASDPRRLPIVRRRGWLVRRGRAGGAPSAAHGRHKRGKQPGERRPRRLGRVLLTLILLALAAAVLYAMMFMPRADEENGQGRTGTAGSQSDAPSASREPSTQKPPRNSNGGGAGSGTSSPDDRQPQSTPPAGLAKGFVVRNDPKGFKVAVYESWTRRGENARDQIRYVGGDFELVVVAGRDRESEFGADPMAYQQNKESELAAFRASSWASSSGLRRIDVGQTAMAEGEFSWRDSSGRNVYARNMAMLINGRYHVVLVIGPADERRAVARYFEQATATYSTIG